MVLTHLARLKKSFGLLMLMQVVSTFSLSFVFIFFKEQGFSLWSLVLMDAILVMIGVVAVLCFNTILLKRFLLFGILGHVVLLFSLAFFQPQISYWFYSVILGLNMVFFWLPINYLFFSTSSMKTNAMDSFLYWVAPSLISILLPPIGAYVIHAFGYASLFYLSCVLYLVPLFLTYRYFPTKIESTIHTNLREEIMRFKSLKTISLVEGALHFFAMLIIPVYALLFFKTEVEVGLFLSYMALISFFISFLLAQYSDSSQQRKKPMFILFLLLCTVTVSLAFVQDVQMWYVAVGVYTLLNTISSPLRLAISMDGRKMEMGFWRIRELFLNLGRVGTLGIAVIFFYHELYWPVFGLFGILTLLYPVLIQYKLKNVR